MQYPQYNPVIIDDDIPQDEIDRLFSLLEAIEPPSSFVDSVLGQLPFSMTATLLPSPRPVALNKLDSWVLENERRKMC